MALAAPGSDGVIGGGLRRHSGLWWNARSIALPTIDATGRGAYVGLLGADATVSVIAWTSA